MGTSCKSFRTQSQKFDYFKLDSVIDARQTDYKVYIHFSVIANKTAAIHFDSDIYSATPLFYRVCMFDIGDDIAMK